MPEPYLKLDVKPRTPLRPAGYELAIASAEDAAQYFDPKHRSYGNVQCLYRAMRVFVGLSKPEQSKFISTFGRKLDLIN